MLHRLERQTRWEIEMRLWTLHPKYLDVRGLVALWREALLAQAVLSGQTVGYLHHPQLRRFRDAASPTGAIACYLQGVYDESCRRGYRFDVGKIGSGFCGEPIPTTQGQLDFEWEHLKEKLRLRAAAQLATLEGVARPEPHPLFRIVPGEMEDWEGGVKRRHRQ
jgi:hypothetical protein